MFTKSTREVTLDLVRGKDSGATVTTRHYQTLPASGYVVGIHGESWRYVPLLDVERIERFVSANLASVDFHPLQYFGIWHDVSTQVVYVDVVEVIHEYSVAVARAAARGEVAIWDIAGSRVIWVDSKQAA